ncbi:MAG: nucleotide sugar dehydrogenase [Patescibacteria group bacterium]|jgi:UDP-N-acetyl-D-mannosaminuronic acid dehydrogenase
MKIIPFKTKIAICGLGYVGFPVALLFAKKGFSVVGVDVKAERVKKINRGGCPIEGKEPGLKELMAEVRQKKTFRATTEPEAYQEAEVIIVAVETPVQDDTHEPAYTAMKAALICIGRNMTKDTLVIVESTIAPGTMAHLVKPILEDESGLKVNEEFLLANCPERLMPGHLLENIQNYNRVIGGMSKEATKTAKDLYQYIVKGKLDETDSVTAEIVKAGENAYRDVQIAFANEMALLCEALGADVWQVRTLINDCKKVKETRPEALRQMHLPGAGVGGHCIPKDSWLLTYGAKNLMDPKIIPLARQINDFMPQHTFDLVKQAFKEASKNMVGAKIVVLGFAYAGNSDDIRNTPAEPLISYLEKAGAKVVVHDPYVKAFKGSLAKIVKGASALVLVTDHDQYKILSYNRLKGLMKISKPILVDGRNVFDKAAATQAGFIYKGIGNI